MRSKGYNTSMDERTGIAKLRSLIPAILGLSVEDWCEGVAARPADAQFAVAGQRVAVRFRAAATSEQIGSALQQMSAGPRRDVLPLLVVPYMGPAGRELCRAAGVSWLDLSGNADVSAPPIRIRIIGEPNRYRRPGRPASLFAPRSSRLARVLLLEPDRIWPQSALVRATGLDSGHLSRLLPLYVESGFVQREQEGRTFRYRVIAPNALLDVWRAAYDFGAHTVLRGHVASRTGPDLLRELASALGRRGVDYAATGLAGAWVWEPFAAFRTVSLYLSSWPDRSLLAEIGFQEGERGANTWLVIPSDEGVFSGVVERGDVKCVSAVQVYLDLKGQPERSEEAGAELRRTCLAWANGKGQSQL